VRTRLGRTGDARLSLLHGYSIHNWRQIRRGSTPRGIRCGALIVTTSPHDGHDSETQAQAGDYRKPVDGTHPDYEEAVQETADDCADDKAAK
jgi:hypothetical protein